jgi:hypothetical protein
MHRARDDMDMTRIEDIRLELFCSQPKRQMTLLPKMPRVADPARFSHIEVKEFVDAT